MAALCQTRWPWPFVFRPTIFSFSEKELGYHGKFLKEPVSSYGPSITTHGGLDKMNIDYEKASVSRSSIKCQTVDIDKIKS